MKDIFLLDVDDTLLDFGRAEREQVLDTLRAHGIPADDGAAERFHAINARLWKQLERGETTRAELVVERFRLLLRELGAAGDAQALSAHFFGGMGQRAYLLAGAEEFLRALSACGRVYAVTNGSKVLQRQRMAAAGILPCFTDVFISEEVGCNKPQEGYVRHVAEHIPRFCRERAVYVGDSLTSDMVCAERLHVDFILFGRARPAGYAGMVAEDHRAALALIDTL